MIPISSLITPYHPLEQAAPGAVGNALGGLGTFLEDRKQNQVADELNRLKADRSYELEKSATEGKNDYYATQAETAREKLKADAEAKQNASVGKLLDQLPEAHRKGDTAKVSALYDRLKAMGYGVQESDTELPEEKPSPSKDAVQGVNAQTAKGAKPSPKRASIEPPEFAGYDALAAARSGPTLSTSSYATTGEDGEQLPPPPPGTATKSPMPPEIAALAPAGLPASPSAGTPPVKRGGKFTVTDKEGNVIHEYDAPLEKKRVRDQIAQMAEPLVGQARNPEEEKAFQSAADSTAKLVGVLPPDQLVKYFQDSVKTQLGEFKKSRMGDQGGGGPAGPSKTDLKLEGMANEETNRIISRVRSTTHVTAAEDAERTALRGLASLDAASQGGMQQLEALKQHMLELSGKVVTDREMSQFMGSTGVWNEIQAKLGKYANGGELPPEFLKQLRGVLTTGLENARRAKNDAAQNAYQQSMLATGDPRQAAIARGNFNGDFSVDDGASKPKLAPRQGPAKPAAPHAPGGGDEAARKAKADAELKALGL